MTYTFGGSEACLSLAAWGTTAVERGVCTQDELAYLQSEMEVRRACPASDEISWFLAQAVYSQQ